MKSRRLLLFTASSKSHRSQSAPYEIEAFLKISTASSAIGV